MSTTFSTSRPGWLKLKKSGERHLYRLTRSLLKTTHCFKSIPDALYFKLLHFLAMICHSFSQSWGFPLVLVSQVTTQCRLSEQVNFCSLRVKETSLFVTRNPSATPGNYFVQRTHQWSDTQSEKNPQFPWSLMLFNKQLVYAKNAFLEEQQVFVTSWNRFFLGRLILKITYEAWNQIFKTDAQCSTIINMIYYKT